VKAADIDKLFEQVRTYRQFERLWREQFDNIFVRDPKCPVAAAVAVRGLIMQAMPDIWHEYKLLRPGIPFVD